MQHDNAPGGDNDHLSVLAFGRRCVLCRCLACFVENIFELGWKIHFRHTRLEQIWINFFIAHDELPFEVGGRVSGKRISDQANTRWRSGQSTQVSRSSSTSASWGRRTKSASVRE